jgi:hypothetical protein
LIDSETGITVPKFKVKGQKSKLHIKILKVGAKYGGSGFRWAADKAWLSK